MLRVAELLQEVISLEKTGRAAQADAVLVIVADQLDFFKQRRSFMITPEGQAIDMQDGSHFTPALDHNTWLAKNIPALDQAQKDRLAQAFCDVKMSRDLERKNSEIDEIQREIDDLVTKQSNIDPSSPEYEALSNEIELRKDQIYRANQHSSLSIGCDLASTLMDRGYFLEGDIPDMLLPMALSAGWARKQIVQNKIYYSIFSKDREDFLKRLAVLKPLVDQDKTDYPGMGIWIEADGYRPNNQRIFSADIVNMLSIDQSPNPGQPVRDWIRSRITPLSKKKNKFVKVY